MINTLQFLVLYPDIQGVYFPAHLTMFLNKLRIIADGDFIPIAWRVSVIKMVFSKEYVDYNEESRLLEIGGIFFFGAMTLLTAIIVGIVFSLMKVFKYEWVSVQSMKESIFWNAFIRFSLECYLEISFLSMHDLS